MGRSSSEDFGLSRPPLTKMLRNVVSRPPGSSAILGKKPDPENAIVGQTYMDTCSKNHGCQDVYPYFGVQQRRRVLSDAGNLPAHDTLPKPWKKTKAIKNKATGIAQPRKSSKLKGIMQPRLRRGLGDAEPMDTGDLHIDNKIQKMLVRLPPGVVDIDADITDPFLCPNYAQDIMHYSQSQELKWVLPADYLEVTNSAIKASMRAVLIDWLIQVQDHLVLQQETLHLCVGLMDQYLHQKCVSVEKLQLLGTAALFVASKYNERFSPEVETLVQLTDDTYTYQDVIRTELKILDALGFDMSKPSPAFFLERLLQVETTGNTTEVEHTARYLLDLTLTNTAMVVYSESMKAACALYLARLILVKEDAWTAGLAYYSKYSERDLLPCFEQKLTMLSKAPKCKLQAARKKYSCTSRFNNISNDVRLLDHDRFAEFLCQREF